MTSPTPPPSAALDVALRRVHRSVLLVLVVCAFVTGVVGGDEPNAKPEPVFTWGAIALAAGAILLRRVPGSTRGRVYGTLVSMLCAAGLGLLGVAMAATQGGRQIPLLYALAGAILWLRPPASATDATESEA